MKKPESSCVTDETRLMDLIFSCAKERKLVGTARKDIAAKDRKCRRLTANFVSGENKKIRRHTHEFAQ